MLGVYHKSRAIDRLSELMGTHGNRWERMGTNENWNF